jgi:hypothetical protein
MTQNAPLHDGPLCRGDRCAVSTGNCAGGRQLVRVGSCIMTMLIMKGELSGGEPAGGRSKNTFSLARWWDRHR